MLNQAAVSALNHLLARSPWARERLLPFAGSRLRIEGGALPDLMLAIGHDGHLAEALADEPPQLILRLPADLFARLAREGREGVMRGVRIEGDAELADALGFVLRNLQWDVEDDLARWVGDIAAHRLVGGARALAEQQRRFAASLAGNLGEYLTEEAALLITAARYRPLSAEIAELRDRVERLDKRLKRLEQR